MPNSLDFNELLQLIRDGQPVSAGTPNRPLAALDERTRYLWDVLKASFIGSTCIARELTIEPDAKVGMPVYFNAATNRFERGLADIAYDPALQNLASADSSQVWGIVLQKLGATLADILLFGYAKVDLTNTLEAGQTPGPGAYFLSRVTPGALTRIRPPIAVPVLRASGDGYVFVNPEWDELPESHVHLHFKLKPTPAGTHVDPGSGNRHVITHPNVHVEGWLPASHTSFGGKAPHDAKFGYNLAANPGLKAAWPPIPPEEAVLELNGVKLPSGPLNGLVIFDRNGIWWMSDCYEDVPWQIDEATKYVRVSESIEESETPAQCPFQYETRLDLYFTVFHFNTENSVVTSLITRDPRLAIYCAGKPEVPAFRGPLEVALKLAFLIDDGDPGGHLALKSFDPDLQKFRRGPIVAGVYAKSSSLTIVSDFQTSEQVLPLPADKTTVHHGNVGIDLSGGFDREIYPQLVRLSSGASEELFEDVMYLAFAKNFLSSIRVRFHVPESLTLASPRMHLRLRIFARVIGVTPALTVTVRRIPSVTVPAVLPAADGPVTINTQISAAATNEYADVLSSPFAVAAGDDVLFTIQRSASDGYSGEVGLLRIAGLLADN